MNNALHVSSHYITNDVARHLAVVNVHGIIDVEWVVRAGSNVYCMIDVLQDMEGNPMSPGRTYAQVEIMVGHPIVESLGLYMRHIILTYDSALEQCTYLANEGVPCDGAIAHSRTSMVQYKI